MTVGEAGPVVSDIWVHEYKNSVFLIFLESFPGHFLILSFDAVAAQI